MKGAHTGSRRCYRVFFSLYRIRYRIFQLSNTVYRYYYRIRCRSRCRIWCRIRCKARTLFLLPCGSVSGFELFHHLSVTEPVEKRRIHWNDRQTVCFHEDPSTPWRNQLILSHHIVSDIAYDIAYDIVYDIVCKYDIRYRMQCRRLYIWLGGSYL